MIKITYDTKEEFEYLKKTLCCQDAGYENSRCKGFDSENKNCEKCFVGNIELIENLGEKINMTVVIGNEEAHFSNRLNLSAILTTKEKIIEDGMYDADIIIKDKM